MLRIEKVVSTLPDPISASTLYFVRAGLGIDVYVSDSSGIIAHKVNVSEDQVLATKLGQIYNGDEDVTVDDSILMAISKLDNKLKALNTNVNNRLNEVEQDVIEVANIAGSFDIIIKDSLRQSVEVTSGGEQTVLYTAKGQPTYMNIVKKFEMSTIHASITGTHPAFIVNGVEKPEIFVGTYQGVIKNGELLSLPNEAPATNLDYATFLNAVRSNGNGHHLITNAEWAALALRSYKDATQPLGNNYYGRSAESNTLVGRRVDELTPGIVASPGVVLTGSGPMNWRQNGKINGIADMSGNIWEWNSGLRIVNGEIQVIPDNNASSSIIDLEANSTEWKAISGANGSYLTPDGNGTTPNSVRIASSGAANYTLTIGSLQDFGTMTQPVKPALQISNAALSKLRALCLFLVGTSTASFNSDGVFINPAIEGLCSRGGAWADGTKAGIFSFSLSNLRTRAELDLGARPAYIKP